VPPRRRLIRVGREREREREIERRGREEGWRRIWKEKQKLGIYLLLWIRM
jgi:chloramphenicol 3-O-phosphotransferase